MNTTPPNLKDQVLTRIDREKVCPRGRFLFLCYDSLVWLFWGLSVAVGSVAVAVSLFVITNSRTALYEVTHGSFWMFLVQNAPWLWLVLFGIMVMFAILNLKYSRRGYRLAVVHIMASSVLLSIVGGGLLQVVSVGYMVDSMLGKRVALYSSQQKMERELWLMPHEGRLVGRQVLSTTAPTSTVIFEDATGVRWTMDVRDMPAKDMMLLSTNQSVRIVGTTTYPHERRFHACGALPWEVKGDGAVMPITRDERRDFFVRMYEHQAKTAVDPIDITLASVSPCAQVATLRRLERYLEQ